VFGSSGGVQDFVAWVRDGVLHGFRIGFRTSGRSGGGFRMVQGCIRGRWTAMVGSDFTRLRHARGAIWRRKAIHMVEP